MVLRGEVVEQWRCVRQTLQHGIQETCVSHVAETCSHTSRTLPFHLQLSRVVQNPLGRRDTVSGSLVIPRARRRSGGVSTAPAGGLVRGQFRHSGIQWAIIRFEALDVGVGLGGRLEDYLLVEVVSTRRREVLVYIWPSDGACCQSFSLALSLVFHQFWVVAILVKASKGSNVYKNYTDPKILSSETFFQEKPHTCARVWRQLSNYTKTISIFLGEIMATAAAASSRNAQLDERIEKLESIEKVVLVITLSRYSC